ncbi:MAG: rhodanese-like domain-containing protein, partial [Pseudomonadota bacterium]|nr:rhodanese-like domain-containing protein [Pseudomonadota bacterium]
MSSSPLISASSLLSALAADAPPVLIDTSFDLTDTGAGRAAWQQGHLPGSLYLHLERDLSGARTGRNGRHPLPARSDFAQTLGRCGITPARQVVAYDRQGGMYAARLWWMLRWMGHAEVAVLDGGVAAWVEAGGSLSTAERVASSAPPYPDRAP